jgi:hypothetical protein
VKRAYLVIPTRWLKWGDVECAGITAAESAGQARYTSALGAQDVGYDIGPHEITAWRLPALDAWAAEQTQRFGSYVPSYVPGGEDAVRDRLERFGQERSA